MIALAVLAVEGIGWAVTQAAGGVVEGSGDRLFSATLRHVRDALPGLVGTPAGDDLARGLRRAQLRALERSILDFEAGGGGRLLNNLAPRTTFIEQALRYCRDSRNGAASASQSGFPAVIGSGVLGLAHHGALADESSSTAGSRIENAVLDELRVAVRGAELPHAFEEHFRSGGRGTLRYSDLFVRYFAEQIKEDDGFRAVLTTGLALHTAAQVASVADLLVAIEERFGTGVRRVESGVAVVHEEVQGIAATQGRHEDILREVLERVSAEKGVPVAPLREVLRKMGVDEDVPVDQIASRLAEKADELNLFVQQLTNGSAGGAVDAVQREVLDLINAADFAGARRRLSEARASVREARQQRSLEEAALLAAEAGIDRLELRYLDAAARYREAEALVTSIDADLRFQYLSSRASMLQQHGAERGANAALHEAIAVWTEAGSLRPRSEHPLEWATTQNNLGIVLQTLGTRERGTARLEEAVVAYRAALEERTRERVPLDWATTQNNLGNALASLGAREIGTARLKEAVAAYRAALEEFTRKRVPLNWAATQNNLGIALQTLGTRERGTARLEAAVAAYRAALEEWTRERVPLDWAATQNNLGNALRTLGERESGTARLEEAVVAFRAALRECTRERLPLDWAGTQNNLGAALQTLGERESGTARLEEAVVAHRAALGEYTRERVPLDWAGTQNNLGNALQTLGERRGDPAQVSEAIDAYRLALEVFEKANAEYYIQGTRVGLADAQALLASLTSENQQD